MDEEEQKKPEGEEQATKNSSDGSDPQVPKATQDAREAAKDLEAATERAEKANAEARELNAQKELGGVEAGQSVENKEETPKEYGKRMLAGK